ncbi:NAD(P)-binding protein [Mollisia scopiformis]|uniref:NAD(P)-binding protein n=1 Tax=Mollisia scopiformis TaxID=149040 RepID=A0A194XU72_MOLSC|nr:NAD(P)-binding protein [Mollisia scopiformis]KUJ23758.1 NAD(P)-binding protein [Mollisia scopiformis]
MSSSRLPPQLGWIGLGSMGIGMAKNLQKHLKSTGAPALCFTNRTMSRGASLEELGGEPYQSVVEVIQNSDIVFTSLSDDSALETIVTQVLAAGNLKNKIVVDTSTVHPDSTVEASSRLSEAGALFAAAPVFGASPVAEVGQLLFIVAGPAAATSAIEPYLKGVMGRGVISLGEDVSKASLMKTSGNFITAAMMEIIAEAHVFAEKTGGSLQGAYARVQPWSDLNLAIKDVGHGINCAQSAGARLKVGEIALGHLEEAKKYSEGQEQRPLYSSSLYGIIRQDAGLDFESEFVEARDDKATK